MEPTLERLFKSLERSNFDAEVIVIDDGSSDDTYEAANAVKSPSGVKLEIVKQKNTGRYLARKAGVERSTKDNVLFVDSRVFVDESSLEFLSDQLASSSDQIWNGHVNIDKKGNIFARFWDAIVCIAWRRYFKKPKTTSYGIDVFDYYPKGTGFFFVPKKRLQAAMEFFEKSTNDLRHSSDDTLLIRFLAERQNIHLSPEFSCVYHGRSNLRSFLTHAYSRGQFFIDGFLRPGTRFFLPLVGVLILSVALVSGLLVFPAVVIPLLVIGLGVLTLGLLIGALAFGVAWKDALSLSILGAPFALVYLAGLWRGVVRKFKYIEKIAGFITKRRVLLRGTIGEYLVVAILYLLVMMAFTGTVMANMNTQIYSSPGDSTAGFLWINSTDKTVDPFVSHYENTNYPFGEDTTGITLVSYLAYWFPMRILSAVFAPVIALNTIMFAGYLLSAMAMYLVIKRLTGTKLIAFTAGFAAAFVPYAIIKSAGHMSYIFGGILTLIVGAFLAFWQRPNVIKALVLGGLLGLAFYVDGYFILMAIVLAIAMTIAGVIYSIAKRDKLKAWILKIKNTLVALAIFSLMVAPIFIINATQGQKIASELASNRSEIGQEIRSYRSNVIDFMVPQQGSLLWKDDPVFNQLTTYKNQRSNSSENTLYISWVIYLISAIGVALFLVRLLSKKHSSLAVSKQAWNDIALVCLLVTVAIPLLLSFMFSPEIIVKGIAIPLPGAWLVEQNISFWRVMPRLFVVYNVVVVLWATISLWMIVTALCQSRFIKPTVKKITSVVLVLGVLAFVAIDYATIFPSRPFDFTETPETYKWLSRQDSIDSVAMIPLTDALDYRVGDYATAQITHGKSIVNQKVPNDIRLNNALGQEFSEETLNFLRDRDVDVAIFYSDSRDCRRPDVGKILYAEETVRYDMQLRQRVSTLLCTIQIDKSDKKIDPVYAVFRDGFSPSAGADDQSKVAFREGGIGDIYLTIDDFRTKFEGRVLFKAKLRLIPEVRATNWQIIQGGVEVASGSLDNKGLANISAIVDGSKSLQVLVNTPNYKLKLAEAFIEQVIVSAKY